jgi:hypothetical protein
VSRRRSPKRPRNMRAASVGVETMLMQGVEPESIARLCDVPIEFVHEVAERVGRQLHLSLEDDNGRT